MRLAVIETVESLRTENIIDDYSVDIEEGCTSVFANLGGNRVLIYRERGTAEYAYPMITRPATDAYRSTP